MKKHQILIALIILSVMGLIVTRTAVLNNLSIAGLKLGKIQTELDSVRLENSRLKKELLKLSSLNYISSQASLLGFVEGKGNFTFNKPIPLAIKQ
ncbi:MAG: hypothetical protein A2629_00385 [Candidatus Levybacteria bacterium RIFCSPHIGHO2_01_FULL_41_15]|nr:MAG: hypothetical protein A2629_00385 [Candidatus Levybacteria bacterium RIFCSPHIGHO2_01_FULL_41_15]